VWYDRSGWRIATAEPHSRDRAHAEPENGWLFPLAFSKSRFVRPKGRARRSTPSSGDRRRGGRGADVAGSSRPHLRSAAPYYLNVREDIDRPWRRSPSSSAARSEVRAARRRPVVVKQIARRVRALVRTHLKDKGALEPEPSSPGRRATAEGAPRGSPASAGRSVRSPTRCAVSRGRRLLPQTSRTAPFYLVERAARWDDDLRAAHRRARQKTATSANRSQISGNEAGNE